MNYAKDSLSMKCNLCLCNAEDHLLQCPALFKEHLQLKEEVEAKLLFWKIPFASTPLKSYEMETRSRWNAAARKRVAPSLPNSTMDIITKSYWKANTQKQFISKKNFVSDLSLCLKIDFPSLVFSFVKT